MRLFRFAVLAVIALLWAGRHDTVFAAESTSYPITIKHAFGNTMIAKKPERVATVAWANHEVPLALGIVPVGMARANFGDDDGDGILPWVDARLGELKAEKPVLFDEGDGIDFEAVAARDRTSSFAPFGLSQADYDTLSDIALSSPIAGSLVDRLAGDDPVEQRRPRDGCGRGRACSQHRG